MSAISGALSSIISHSKLFDNAPAAQTSASGNADSFGDATNVTLSPEAQAAAGGSAAAAPAGGGKAASVPVQVTPSTSASDTATLVEEAVQELEPKIGLTGADDVVDSQGNINYAKLNELLLKQVTATNTATASTVKSIAA